VPFLWQNEHDETVMRSVKHPARFFTGLALLAILTTGILHWVHRSNVFPELAASSLDQWHAYGGDWHMADGVMTDRSSGRGDKIVAGPKDYGNYVVSAEMRFDSMPGDPQFGDAGLLLRVQDPAIGVDAHRGYYVGLRPDDHTLLIGAHSFSFREVATTPFPHEIHTGRWYRLTFASEGCTFHASVVDLETDDKAEVSYVEQSCTPLQGQVGLRSYYAKASWRRLKVKLTK
jgi:hypothetical protein